MKLFSSLVFLVVFIVGISHLSARPIHATVGVTYTQQDQQITFNPPTDLRYGDVPFKLVATASSGLPVTFSIVSGPASIRNDSLVLTGAGKVVVRVSQDGDSNYYPATSQERSININKANQTITFDKLPSRTMVESPFTLVASASSGLPVELTVAAGPAILTGNELTLTGEGLVTIRAYQAGNALFNSAPYVNQSFTVTKADQTLLFKDISEKALPQDPFFNKPFPFTVQASSSLPVTVSISFGPATLSGNQITLTGAGKVYVRATQAGNTVYNAITVDTAFCVLPAQPLVTVSGMLLTSSSAVGNQWFRDGLPIAGGNKKVFMAQKEGYYSVQVANPDAACGPSALSEAIEIYITGLEEADKTWQIYPNPASEWLMIRSSAFLANRSVRVSVLSSAGQFISQHLLSPNEQGEVQLATDRLQPGLYFLQITAGKQTRRLKIMIQ